MIPDTKTLKACILFSTMTDEEADALMSSAELRNYLEGQYVCREGDPGDGLFILIQGEVAITKKIGADIEKEIARLGPGDFFGEMSLIDGQPRSAGAKAVSHSVAIALSSSRFEAMMEESGSASNKLMHSLLRVLSKRLRDTNDLLRKIVENEVEQKHEIEDALHAMMASSFSNRLF